MKQHESRKRSLRVSCRRSCSPIVGCTPKFCSHICSPGILPSPVNRKLRVSARRTRETNTARKQRQCTPKGEVVTDNQVSPEVLEVIRSLHLMVRQKPGETNSLGLTTSKLCCSSDPSGCVARFRSAECWESPPSRAGRPRIGSLCQRSETCGRRIFR
jgi:hypothetical protein